MNVHVLFDLQAFCIGILIPAAVAIPAINEVEDSLEQRGSEYEGVDGYRGVAIYLVCLSFLAMVFHIFMITVRILYLTSVVKKFDKYVLLLVSE